MRLLLLALLAGCANPPVVTMTLPATLAESAPLEIRVTTTGAPAGGQLLLDGESIPLDGTINGALGASFTITTFAPAAPPAGRDVALSLTIVDANGKSGSATGTLHVTDVGLVRAFAVGWHMHTSAGASQEAFAAEMNRLVDRMRPSFATDRPNLLVLPEHVALVTMVAGSRGAEARTKTTLVDAFAFLMRGYAAAIDDASVRYSAPFARSLLLAVTDTVWRAYSETFSAIARREHVFIAAGADVADVMETSDPQLVAAYGDPDHPERKTAFIPIAEGKPYNQSILFGPDGRILGRTHKVNLVPLEQTFQFSPGKLEDVKVFDTPAGKLGAAISLDAFTDSYMQRLASLGAEIVVQNDANDGPWCGPGGGGRWQPLEWVDSILGALDAKYAPARYDVCPMMVGNLFDLQFDGQTTITAADSMKPAVNLIAVDDQAHDGKFLFLGPWAFPDPKLADPQLTLAERQAMLSTLSQSLAPGGAHDDQYIETIGFADFNLMN